MLVCLIPTEHTMSKMMLCLASIQDSLLHCFPLPWARHMSIESFSQRYLAHDKEQNSVCHHPQETLTRPIRKLFSHGIYHPFHRAPIFFITGSIRIASLSVQGPIFIWGPSGKHASKEDNAIPLVSLANKQPMEGDFIPYSTNHDGFATCNFLLFFLTLI